jgi:hypothetical protein
MKNVLILIVVLILLRCFLCFTIMVSCKFCMSSVSLILSFDITSIVCAVRINDSSK